MQSLTTENTEENAMTKCNQAEFVFPSCKSRKVVADFAARRIRLHLSSVCPHQDLFAIAAARLE